ncbi:MAG: 4-hydroxy-tetrahydrodipicolinate reductase [Acholeplasmataceae bacterium]
MRILISGISGKMGQLLKSDILSSNDFEFAGGFDLVEDIKEPLIFDVCVDFSHVSQVNKVIDYVKHMNKPLVIATTGLSDDHFKYIDQASKSIAIFQSYNYSFGIQVLLKALQSVLPMISDFDIEITEKHHQYKVDAPSGTAITIYEEIKKQRKDAEPIYQYDSQRKSNQVGIHSLRAGSIVGEHEVLLATKDEMITIKHEALSKQIFTQGALRAAKFINDKKSGLYHMTDLVKEML